MISHWPLLACHATECVIDMSVFANRLSEINADQLCKYHAARFIIVLFLMENG